MPTSIKAMTLEFNGTGPVMAGDGGSMGPGNGHAALCPSYETGINLAGVGWAKRSVPNIFIPIPQP
jgi:hypothetical protein